VKKIIYSVLVGPYDTVADAVPFDGWEYVLFTDQPIAPQGWQIRPLEWTCGCPIRTSRYHKILAPPEADITVYIDANMTLLANPDTFVKDGIGLRLHPSRQNIQEEAEAILERRLDTRANVLHTINKFKSDYPLTENGLIARKGNCGPLSDVSTFNYLWWNVYSQASHRDQLTLPYVVDQLGRKPYTISPLVVRIDAHKQPRKTI
jgi:hypothetical protein